MMMMMMYIDTIFAFYRHLDFVVTHLYCSAGCLSMTVWTHSVLVVLYACLVTAVTKLKVIWNEKNIAISSKIRLMRSLAMSIFLYACETWTITADIERRIQALEMRCFRKLLGISDRDHITNEEVKARIGNAIGQYEDLLTTVKRRKLKWYGHVTRSSGLAKTILQ